MKSVVFLALFVAFAVPCVAETSLGVASIRVMGADQTRPLDLSLWYPGRGGTQEDVGANAVFTGSAAGRGATLTEDRLPVVFVSHGGVRSAGDSGAWLSAGLARAGFLAVEINAPRPAASAAVDEIWRRPDDVSRALDAILTDPAWSAHIDQDRISVVGFALGGTAALALAGGIFEPEAFVRSCDTPAHGPDCAWYHARQIALGSVDRAELASRRRDPRITSIVTLAPEYLDIFSGGLSSIEVPMLFIGLGGDAAPPMSVQARFFAQSVIPDTDMSDGFQTCTPAGPKILADDGGDPALCGSSAAARQQAHDAILKDILAFFRGLDE